MKTTVNNPRNTVVAALISGLLFATSSIVFAGDMTPPTFTLNNCPSDNIFELSDAPVSTNPANGNITAEIRNTENCPSTASVGCDDITVNSLFTVNGSNSSITVDQGNPVNFVWSSIGAATCQTTSNPTFGNWSGPETPSGQANIVASVDPGVYSVTLQCSNGPCDSDLLTREITVEESTGNGPQECIDQGRVPPAGITQDTAIRLGSSSTTLTHEDVFNSPFPGGTDIDMEIDENKYASIRFDTGNVSPGEEGSFRLNTLFSTSIRNGRKLVTLSKCPGDFLPQADNLCVREVFAGNIEWRIGAGGEPICNLDPNTIYYINILYTEDDAPPSNWSCSAWPDGDGRCGNTFNP